MLIPLQLHSWWFVTEQHRDSSSESHGKRDRSLRQRTVKRLGDSNFLEIFSDKTLTEGDIVCKWLFTVRMSLHEYVVLISSLFSYTRSHEYVVLTDFQLYEKRHKYMYVVLADVLKTFVRVRGVGRCSAVREDRRGSAGCGRGRQAGRARVRCETGDW